MKQVLVKQTHYQPIPQLAVGFACAYGDLTTGVFGSPQSTFILCSHAAERAQILRGEGKNEVSGRERWPFVPLEKWSLKA